MIVHNEDAEYTEEYKEFMDNEVLPAIREQLEKVFEWIEENEGTGMDYRYGLAAIVDEMELEWQSRWLTYIGQRDTKIFNEWKEDNNGQ